MDRLNTAGMSITGGRKDNFFFCLLEYYSDSDRWFLRSLLHVKDEEKVTEGDDAIRTWIEDYRVSQLVVNFPLSYPVCHTCNLTCPGASKCPVDEVVEVRMKMNQILLVDEKIREENPKKYERERNEDDLVEFEKDFLSRETNQHLLSRSFKRRLKRGFSPYWNRPVDYWVWSHYYDQLLNLFKISYDSFGNTSFLMMMRSSYLRRHFPERLKLFEGNIHITFVELLRANILSAKDLQLLNDFEEGSSARKTIVESIEKKLKFFIYENDKDLLVRDPRAFESFILALSGRSVHLNQFRSIPNWAKSKEVKMIIPLFK